MNIFEDVYEEDSPTSTRSNSPAPDQFKLSNEASNDASNGLLLNFDDEQDSNTNNFSSHVPQTPVQSTQSNTGLLLDFDDFSSPVEPVANKPVSTNNLLDDLFAPTAATSNTKTVTTNTNNLFDPFNESLKPNMSQPIKPNLNQTFDPFASINIPNLQTKSTTTPPNKNLNSMLPNNLAFSSRNNSSSNLNNQASTKTTPTDPFANLTAFGNLSNTPSTTNVNSNGKTNVPFNSFQSQQPVRPPLSQANYFIPKTTPNPLASQPATTPTNSTVP